MTTTVEMIPPTGSGVVPRASINGLQFIETTEITGSGLLPPAKIGSTRRIHTILGWTPELNSIGNPIAGSVTANFKAENSDPLDLDFATGSAFEDFGTLDNTNPVGTGIQLATAAPIEDFNDFISGTSITSASQPRPWTDRASSPWKWSARDAVAPFDTKCAYTVLGNGVNHASYTDAGDIASGTVSLDYYHATTYGDGACCIHTNVYGSGSALRGHVIQWGSGSRYVQLRRLYSETYWYGYGGTLTLPFYLAKNVHYKIKLRFTTNGVNTWWYFKIWIDGASEPVDFSYIGTDTWVVAAGAVGISASAGVNAAEHRIDNFKVEPDPAVFASSGTWTSIPLDVSAVKTFGSGRINFTKTTPAGTTAKLLARWKSGDPYVELQPGDTIPGATYRDVMDAGAARSELELLAELATTDPGETPEIDDLEVSFVPTDPSDMEMNVDGQLATIENGHLTSWGILGISAGAEVNIWTDTTVQAWGLINYKNEGEAINVDLDYSGQLIGSNVFSQLLQPFKYSAGANCYFVFSSGALEGAANVSFTTIIEWFVSGKNYEWTLIDRSQGLGANAYYYVGHAQIDDFLGSMIVGAPEINDILGSMIVRGWKRDDFLGSMLVQGWRSDDFLGSVLPGRWTLDDFLGSVVVGKQYQADFLGSAVVLAVNRNNAVEVRTIDAGTAAKLAAIGFIFPPKGT